jgi:hypothetical protein
LGGGNAGAEEHGDNQRGDRMTAEAKTTIHSKQHGRVELRVLETKGD